jgi:putative membrane protein
MAVPAPANARISMPSGKLSSGSLFRLPAFILVAVALAACSLFKRELQPEPPSDAEVAADFLTANSAELSYARIALSGSGRSNKEVADFARRMLDDHGALFTGATDSLAAWGIVPEDNPRSLELRDQSAAWRDTLRSQPEPLFDSTYIAFEVRDHTRMLVMLDSLLIPAARSPGLYAMLTTARPVFAAHLDHAQRVQASLVK